MMLKALRIWAPVALLTLFVMGAPVRATLATDPLKCQAKIAAASRSHYDSVYTAWEKCYQSILRGTDCSFTAVLDTLGKADRKLELDLRGGCVGTAGEEQSSFTNFGVGLLGPSDLNFPASSISRCVDTTETANALSFRELTRCLVAENARAVGNALANGVLAQAFGDCTTKTMTLDTGSQSLMQTLGSQLTVGLSGTIDLCIGTANASGKRLVLIPAAGAVLNPVTFGGFTVCPHVLGGGGGQVSCTATTASTMDHLPNLCARQDHQTDPTTPVSPTAPAVANTWTDATKACNTSFPYQTACTSDAPCGVGSCALAPKYGGPNDSSCTKTSKSGGLACREADCDGTGGASNGDGLQGGTCTGCNANANSTRHTNACNSPIATTGSAKACSAVPTQACCQDSDCWNNGLSDKCITPAARADGEMVVGIAIGYDVSITGGCTPTDNYFTRTSPSVSIFTTGLAQTGIADAAGPSGTPSGGLIWRDSTQCSGSCTVSDSGAPVSCTSLLGANGTKGLKLVSSVPFLDGFLGDAVVTQTLIDLP